MKKVIKLTMALGLVGATAAHAAIDYGAAGVLENPLTTNVVLATGDYWYQTSDITIQGGSVDASITDLYRLRVGHNSAATLTIDGGSFDWQGTGQDTLIGNDGAGNALIDLLSGSLNIGDTGNTLYIGRDEGTGVVRIQGGVATFGMMPTFDAVSGNGSIDFTTANSGTLTIAGADKAYYEGLYAGTDLTFNSMNAANGAGAFDEQFSVVGSTITAIPEPGTLGLVAVFGGGVLFIRRRFMI